MSRRIVVVVLALSAGALAQTPLDLARLAFVDRQGRRDQTLTVIAGLFTPHGQFVTGRRGVLELALDGSHYQHFRQQGLGATLRLSAPPGAYRLRVAIGESSDGKLTALTRPVTVR